MRILSICNLLHSKCLLQDKFYFVDLLYEVGEAGLKEKFISRLGTKVTINGDLNKGNIVIEYYSMEDLDRLYEILGS